MVCSEKYRAGQGSMLDLMKKRSKLSFRFAQTFCLLMNMLMLGT